ncbi:hypothetical protein TrRE_jg6468 [Triparma retinervis]|uniref:Ferredoxin--nitrite reductase, chloroplastic n=1 Tax=Triparma retinervis TaxID=2557542 RepID=A0A9W7DL60_9STRA|nr:hypothetical protein TrRE_jg6468 [Triparma retinervis]
MMFYSLLLVSLPIVSAFPVPFTKTYTTSRPLYSTKSKPAVPSGSSFLPESTLSRIIDNTPNPTEKAKLARDPTNAWTDIYDFADKIRNGELTWEELDGADVDIRLKWVGMLHRRKRKPGTFMMRLKVPNGIVNSSQMRFFADCVSKYPEDVGVIDITTRQNIQMRGVTIETAPDIIDGLHARNLTSFQSALDNVRNVVGSPLAGLDPLELVDTRPLCNALNDLVSMDPSTGLRGNPKWGNLGRKFNIAISGSRDDFAHTHINDIGMQAVKNEGTGEAGFNVVLGGYMSIKRVAESVKTDIWVRGDIESVHGLCDCILEVFRDEGERKDRQKARLMWLVEKYGVEEFGRKIKDMMKERGLETDGWQGQPDDKFERRGLLGVHKQKQEGLNRVGVLVPVGRLNRHEAREIADVADKYSGGEVRLTVEQNVILPNVKDEDVTDLLAEPMFGNDKRLKVKSGNIEGGVVSCTGSQFCGLAMIETKQTAERYASILEGLVACDKTVRIHWTGCPNSCGQVQAADIGLMGCPARKVDPDTGKSMAVPGVNIFVGGTIGENGALQMEPDKKGVLVEEETLIPELVEIIVERFGGRRIGEGGMATLGLTTK